MLSSQEELAKQYSILSDQKLLDILYNKEEYRPEAIEAVIEELKKRNITTEKTTDFIHEKEKKKIIALENELIPLPLHQKLLFFFAWFIPAFFGGAFRLNYQEEGMLKKLSQSRQYSVAGFLSLVLTTILTVSFSLGNITGFVILAGCFSIFYIFEQLVFDAK